MWRKIAKIMLWVYLGMGALFALIASIFMGVSMGHGLGNGALGFFVGLVIFLFIAVLVCYSLCNFGMRIEQADNVAKIREEICRTGQSGQKPGAGSGYTPNPGHIHQSHGPSGSNGEGWVCSSCGRVNPDYAKVCPGCGNRRRI